MAYSTTAICNVALRFSNVVRTVCAKFFIFLSCTSRYSVWWHNGLAFRRRDSPYKHQISPITTFRHLFVIVNWLIRVNLFCYCGCIWVRKLDINTFYHTVVVACVFCRQCTRAALSCHSHNQCALEYYSHPFPNITAQGPWRSAWPFARWN